MGRWGPGNFDDDLARDHLAKANRKRACEPSGNRMRALWPGGKSLAERHSRSSPRRSRRYRLSRGFQDSGKVGLI
jgi:hypothetical protein